MSRSRRTRWLGWGLLLAGLLLIGGWAAVTGMQLMDRARSLQAHISYLEQLTQGSADSLGPAELRSARHHLTSLRQDLGFIRSRLGPLLPAVKYLGWVPRYGGELAAADDLLKLAAGLASAGDRTLQSLSPVLDLLAGPAGDPSPSLAMAEQLLPVLAAAGPELRAAQQDLATVGETRARIDAQSLSPQAAGYLARLDRYLPLFETAVDGALLAPELLGANGPRTYLLLAQNNQELRPTGGFISGVGELRAEGGRLASLSFSDSYAVDNLEVPHDLTPPDFQQTLCGELWFFRDTNWDADFPTSAKRALKVYARDRGVEADGVIALDLTALRLLLEALGPLVVEGIEEPVTDRNVMEVIQAGWRSPPATWDLQSTEWFLHRKDSFGSIAAAAMDRLVAGNDLDLARLAQALRQVLEEKHVLVYLADPEAASLLRERNWDGAISDWFSASDMLLVVDTNVGFNKVDANVERSIHYQVDLAGVEGPRATLTLTYHNRSSSRVESCIQEARYGDEYADMMERCYWDYVRVYVPPSSELVAGPELPLPSGSLLSRQGDTTAQAPVASALSEGGWTAWTAFFDLAPGERQTMTFTYELPIWVLDYEAGAEVRYHLRVRKQAGTGAVPLALTIQLPPAAELVHTVPVDLSWSLGSSLTVSTDLRTDREFEVIYREGRQEP